MNRNNKGQFVKGAGFKDITGKRFGKLVVLSYVETKNHKSYWNVRCDCGTEKVVRGDTLAKIVSCGCVKREQDAINFNLKDKNNHGMTHHPAFSIWSAMMNRCYSKLNHYYKDYGGRGIKVCEEWDDVKNFCKWAEDNGFKKGLSIERINVNGNYCPENCCWIPRSKQSRNCRNTIRIVYDGKETPLIEVAEKLNLNYKTLQGRWGRGIRDIDKLLYNGNLANYKKE